MENGVEGYLRRGNGPWVHAEVVIESWRNGEKKVGRVLGDGVRSAGNDEADLVTPQTVFNTFRPALPVINLDLRSNGAWTN